MKLNLTKPLIVFDLETTGLDMIKDRCFFSHRTKTMTKFSIFGAVLDEHPRNKYTLGNAAFKIGCSLETFSGSG